MFKATKQGAFESVFASLSVSYHTIPKALYAPCFCVPFLVVLYLQYCMLEDSPTKCEMCDIYICLRIACGEMLVGRNHIGNEISTSAS